MKNILIIEKADFEQAQLDGLQSDGQTVSLADQRLTGQLVTPVYSVSSAKAYVLSFNTLTHLGGTVELSIRLIAGSKQSIWFSYGRWGVNYSKNGSVKGQSDDFAKLKIDTLNIKPNVLVTGVQFKAHFTRNHPLDASPTLRRIALTNIYQSKEYQSQPVPEIDYTVPQRSQMIIPEIGRYICSPTAVCMVLQYYGETIEPFEAAGCILDNGANTYGNWTYSTAYAAEQGYKAFVYYCPEKAELFDILAQGQPIVASLVTQDETELTGSPQAYPYGHLVVVAGSTHTEDGAKLIINDSAARTDATVRRHYLVDDFMRVWSGILYIIVNEE